MKFPIGALIFLALLSLPFAINALGWNVFLYFGSSEKRYVVAASQGLCHLAATTEPHDYNSVAASFADYGVLPAHKQIIRIGPIDLFAEKRLDPIDWFRFDISKGGQDYDYSAVEFPWLLIPLGPLIPLLIFLRKQRKRKEPNQ